MTTNPDYRPPDFLCDEEESFGGDTYITLDLLAATIVAMLSGIGLLTVVRGVVQALTGR